jgi:hypothetical protein
MDTTAIIEALKAERDGYLRRGRTDRAALVEAELHRLGYETKESGSTVLVEPVETLSEPSQSPPKAPKSIPAPKTPKTRKKS